MPSNKIHSYPRNLPNILCWVQGWRECALCTVVASEKDGACSLTISLATTKVLIRTNSRHR